MEIKVDIAAWERFRDKAKSKLSPEDFARSIIESRVKAMEALHPDPTVKANLERIASESPDVIASVVKVLDSDEPVRAEFRGQADAL